MKRLILAVIMMSMSGMVSAVESYIPPIALCSTEITYTIRDADGKPMDQTTYRRDWPIDCVTQVKAKYLMLQRIFNAGESRFKAMTGE